VDRRWGNSFRLTPTGAAIREAKSKCLLWAHCSARYTLQPARHTHVAKWIRRERSSKMPGARTRRQTHRPTASPRKKRFAHASDQANGDCHGRLWAAKGIVPLRVGEAAGKLGRHNAVARQTAKWLPKMPAPGWSQSNGIISNGIRGICSFQQCNACSRNSSHLKHSSLLVR
jgi:hypothetical protein